MTSEKLVRIELLMSYVNLLMDLEKRGIKCTKEMTDALGELHKEMGFNKTIKNLVEDVFKKEEDYKLKKWDATYDKDKK